VKCTKGDAWGSYPGLAKSFTAWLAAASRFTQVAVLPWRSDAEKDHANSLHALTGCGEDNDVFSEIYRTLLTVDALLSSFFYFKKFSR